MTAILSHARSGERLTHSTKIIRNNKETGYLPITPLDLATDDSPRIQTHVTLSLTLSSTGSLIPPLHSP